jgi:8-oxo-dGTP pyrophosphatase MutT (NUDIX family)
MVRRAREASFMGGARVFPGGAVDAIDSGPQAAAAVRWSGDPAEFPWRAAALRELAEEVGIVIGGRTDVTGRAGADIYAAAPGGGFDADRLQYWSNWVTPRGLPKRFDTRFYVVEVGTEVVARSDRFEVYDPVWVTPRAALVAADAGSWIVEAPTRAHLEMLAQTSDLDGALRAAALAIPVRIEPRLVVDDNGSWSVLMPGDPGFDGAGS